MRRLTLISVLSGRFRMPSLRQVELTVPYMHDGRFATLRDVLEFYSEGIAAHPQLNESLPVGGFGFTEQEKDDLEAFLHTLTDRTVVDSPLYSDPFKKD
jgi:cytochrome c peroxidase